MRSKCIGVLFSLLFLLGSASGLFAGLEWEPQVSLKMGQPPLDVAVSPDGKHIFVLAEGGIIFMYDQDGKFKDKINIGTYVDQIKIGPRGERLFLTNRKDKTVQIIRLNFIVDINVSGSPYKGPPDAPVVIAVFDDFQ